MANYKQFELLKKSALVGIAADLNQQANNRLSELNQQANNRLSEFNQQADQRLIDFDARTQEWQNARGYDQVGTFNDGFTISERNQIAYFYDAGEPLKSTFFRWDGPLPKNVPAGATPEMTGGIQPGAWADVGHVKLREELANPDIGAAMVARGVVAVDSITDLLTMPPEQRRAGLRYEVKSFWPGLGYGGGSYFWDPTTPKSSHDGVTVIDPDKSGSLVAPGSIEGYFTPGSTGAGCFLAEEVDSYDFSRFGAVYSIGIDSTSSWEGLISSTVTRVDLKEGDIYLGGEVHIRSNLTVRGAGKGLSRITADKYNTEIFLTRPLTKNDRFRNIHFSDLTFYGSKVIGTSNTTNSYPTVARTVAQWGWQDFSFTNVEFNTFILSGVYTRKLELDWIVGGDYNTKESVEELLSMNASNGNFIDCAFYNAISSGGVQCFGGTWIKYERCVFDNPRALVDFLADDASQNTPLEDYCVNHHIYVDNCAGSKDLRLDGTTAGGVSRCSFPNISVRSYDFDQQRLNVPNSPNYTGMPFLWGNYVERSIVLSGNTAGYIGVHSKPGVVKVIGNTLTSRSENSTLMSLGNNGIFWVDSNTYWDSGTPTVQEDYGQECLANTFVAAHPGTIGVGYPTQSMLYATIRGNAFHETDGGSFNQQIAPPSRFWEHDNSEVLFSPRDIVLTGGDNSLSILVAGGRVLSHVGGAGDFERGMYFNHDPSGKYLPETGRYSGSVGMNTGNATLMFSVSESLGGDPLPRFVVSRSALSPAGDESGALGEASRRYSQVYASTGTINTSDEREKTQTRALLDAERLVALELKNVLKAFKWKSSVEVKGDDARWHFGVMAQDIQRVFELHGLDAHQYGMFCYDEWDEELDENGEVVGNAGDRYGVRYDQLLAFIISAI